jgi:capsular polysaccharide biosynthesis protein
LQLRDYWPILRKRWPMILGAVVVAVVASYLFTRLQTPIYRATVFLTVTPARNDYGQTLVIQNQLRQYARQLQTDFLAEMVNDRLRLDLALDRLRSKVRVAAVAEDLLLQIEVDDPEPAKARDIAFQWGRQFAENHQNVEASKEPRDRIDVDLLDRPQPAVLNWPKRTQIVMAAAVLGLLLGTLLAFVLEYLDDTLKSGEDVDRFVGLPLLAAIPSADGVVGRPGGTNGHSRPGAGALTRAGRR